MRLDLFRDRHTDGPLSRIDPRWMLLGTLAFVILVVATPVERGTILALEGMLLAFLAGVSGLSPGGLFRRWLGFAVLLGFLATMLALGRPASATPGRLPFALGIVAKNSMAFVALTVLAGVVPFPRLLGAMARLGMPTILVATLHFMFRYLHVLVDETSRMIQARRARNFRSSGRLDWGLLGGLIGVLFVRSLERGERVHAAMLARGWDGTLRTLDGADSV